MAIAQEALTLAEDLKNLQAQALLHDEMAAIYRRAGLWENAIKHYAESALIWENTGKLKKFATSVANKGYTFYQMGVDSLASSNLEQALELFIKKDDTIGILKVESMYTGYLMGRRKWDLAEKHLDSAFKIFDQIKSPLLLDSLINGSDSRFARLSINYARLLRSKKEYERAVEVDMDAIKTLQANGNRSKVIDVYYNLSFLYMNWGEDTGNDALFNQAENYLILCQDYFENSTQAQERQMGLMDVYINFGGLYRRTGDYERSLEYLRKALVLAEQLEEDDDISLIHDMFFRTYKIMGDYEKALTYNEKFHKLEFNLAKAKADERIALSDISYNAIYAKKEAEIANYKLNLRKSQQQRERIFSISLALGLLGISIFLWYLSRNRRKEIYRQQRRNKQQMLDLVTSHTIQNTNIKINSQLKERKKIARNLHDDLGATLSTAKMSLEGMHKSLPHSLGTIYDQTHHLLEKAVNATRDISHSLISNKQTDFSLVEQIKETAEAISLTKKLVIDFQYINLDTHSWDPETEQDLYMIIQEIIQNTIKHADAHSLTIQLNKIEDQLLLVTEDDGKGFDAENEKKQGMGLENMSERVSKLKGTMDIDSQYGIGTTIVMEFPLS